VLDAGCGAGIPVAHYLLTHNCQVTGVDISQEQVRLARENCPNGNFICADLATVDMPPASFDAIVSFYAIFHIPRGEHLGLLTRFASWLKPGGYLLASLGADAWEGIEEFHGVPMYWSHFGREQNLALISQAELRLLFETIDESGDERHLIVFARKP
jgi:SAM-dependent methyltransferase